MAAHGTFYWNELMTHDAETAKAFYQDTIGWTFEGMPMPQDTYWVAKSGDQMVGGIFPMSGAEFKNMPEHWLSYLAVDDVDARLKKATAAGAVIKKPPFEIPGIGRIAIVQEPGGAVIGWMTPTSK
jgi:predicted enzyme related to lactoylglutathione lyase